MLDVHLILVSMLRFEQDHHLNVNVWCKWHHQLNNPLNIGRPYAVPCVPYIHLPYLGQQPYGHSQAYPPCTPIAS